MLSVDQCGKYVEHPLLVTGSALDVIAELLVLGAHRVVRVDGGYPALQYSD